MTAYAWRPSTPEEIKAFYSQEFPSDPSEMPHWISSDGPKEVAVALTKRFPMVGDAPAKDFLRRDTRAGRNGSTFPQWSDVVDFLHSPADGDPVRRRDGLSGGLADPEVVGEGEPLTKAAYYALDHYDQFWVLSFDIDAKDIAKMELCTDVSDIRNVTDKQVERAGFIEEPPKPQRDNRGDGVGLQEYPYRYDHLKQTIELGFKLENWLTSTVGFDETHVFYSGQGVHVYAFDPDIYYQWTYQTRQTVTTYIREKLQIPVDAPVTWDQSRVIRFPHSLHTDVNRKVTEITRPDFDFKNEPVPDIVQKI